ncbi:MAG: hypothetical protein HZB15_08475, partial [Actinobacteria bacterium]|nr:hypothetical protein [Actinomycetota bacterium]
MADDDEIMEPDDLDPDLETEEEELEPDLEAEDLEDTELDEDDVLVDADDEF